MRFVLPLLLTACPPPEKDADTAPPCLTEAAIGIEGDAIPGGEVTLRTSVPGYDVLWSVDVGTLSDATAPETNWSLPVDLCVLGAEVHTVSLTATAPGCDDLSASQERTVDVPPGDRVVILANPSIEGSLDVASAYAAFREVPDDHLCAVAYADSTTVANADYADYATAVQACLDAVGAQVWYLVPVYGVPYKVDSYIYDLAGSGAKWTVSLDALLFMGAASITRSRTIDNPLYQIGHSMDQDYMPYTPFGPLRDRVETASLGYRTWLVTRMDGASADEALALVARAEDAQALVDANALAGIVYVDGNEGDGPPATDNYGSYESGEWNLWGTRYAFEDAALYDVVWDGNAEEYGTVPAPLSCPDALYYAGWYSFNNYNDAFTWTPGAIGGHLDSCSACSLRDTSWSALALQQGITATFGAVNEPYVAGMPEYDQFFLYLLQGASFGEAAYESTTVGLWMMTWIGDPLYRPYPGGISGG